MMSNFIRANPYTFDTGEIMSEFFSEVYIYTARSRVEQRLCESQLYTYQPLKNRIERNGLGPTFLFLHLLLRSQIIRIVYTYCV